MTENWGQIQGKLDLVQVSGGGRVIRSSSYWDSTVINN